MAHSSVPGVPGPLKYPPPPTIQPTLIIHRHSSSRVGAWETLRSAISFKPHAGRLRAALWFSCTGSPGPLQSGSPYEALSEFTCCLITLLFCIKYPWFSSVFLIFFFAKVFNPMPFAFTGTSILALFWQFCWGESSGRESKCNEWFTLGCSCVNWCKWRCGGVL